MKKMPAVFVGHGSPMIALDHNELTETYRRLGERILAEFGKPKAILMISAHWYTRGTLVQSAAKPRQVYDMYGFPKELYELKYEPAGCADLTRAVTDLLGEGVEVDDSWGIDHGTWSILVHIFPQADIPVVQLSINGLIDARQSYELGQKLASLREKGYLIMAAATSSTTCAASNGRMSTAIPPPTALMRPSSRPSKCAMTKPSSTSTATPTPTTPSRRPTTSCPCSTSSAPPEASPPTSSTTSATSAPWP